MSGADLFEDGFPHGTKAGYDRGCRSQGACPSKVETGQSCVDANMRFARSTEYRRLVASGAPVHELATPEAPLADRPAPKPNPASAIPTRILADTGELPAADYAIVPPTIVPAAVVPALKKPRPGKTIKHGTVTGYTDGKCRKSDAESCPSRLAGGRSCYDAYMAWYRASREKKAALRTPTPTVTPEQAVNLTRWFDAPAEEDTVNAAPEKTPELEATLARLREMHPPLNETCQSTYRGMRCRLSSSYIHVLHEALDVGGMHNIWDNEHADKPNTATPALAEYGGSLAKVRASLAKVNEAFAKIETPPTETPALAEDNAQPTTPPEATHTVPADLRRDEDGDLQDMEPDTIVDVNSVTWDRTTADPWTGHELPTPTQELRRSPHDPVNHPQHYTAYKGLEIIDLTEQMNFNRGNAVKYIARAGLKNPDSEIEDLEKAAWYLQREIARIDSKDED